MYGLEVSRMADAALSDGTNGVAVQLAAVPIDSGDTRPGSPAGIRNGYDDGDIWREGDDEAGYFLYVLAQDWNANGMRWGFGGQREATGDVWIVYRRRAGDTAAKARREAHYVIRACAMCFARTWGITNPSRNSVKVLHMPTMRFVPPKQSEDESYVEAALVLEQVKAKDIAA